MDLILRVTRQADQRSAAARPDQARRRAATVVLRTVATAITLAALCLAWPLPVRAAEITPSTTAIANVTAVTNASTDLRLAIETNPAGIAAA